ncbi:MAG TPA: hypothetical protein VF608_03000, partial [Thermoanaerobaculia bacterium]
MHPFGPMKQGDAVLTNLRAAVRILILAAVAVFMLPLQAQQASAVDVPLRDWVVPFSQINVASAQSGRFNVQSN